MFGRSDEIRTCLVCVNVSCEDRGSRALKAALVEKLAAEQHPADVREYICFGECPRGPNIVAYPEGTWYMGVEPEDLDDVVGHIAGGDRPTRLTDAVEPGLHKLILDLLDAEMGG